jgi:hypothetical protein
MTILPPAPAQVGVESDVDERTNGHPPAPRAGHGHGHGNNNGNGRGGLGGGQGGPDDDNADNERSPHYYRRRRSFWPFVLDLGLVLALFGLIITGRPLTVIGAIIFVVALAGWIREARADYSNLSE